MSEQQRARARSTASPWPGLADVLIPAADGMPSASEAGATKACSTRCCRCEDLEEPLRAIAAAARGKDPAAEVARLEGRVAGAVRGPDHRGGGWLLPQPGRAPAAGLSRPAGQELEDDFDQELLQPVIDRGPIFRPTPDPDSSGA